MSVYLRYSFLTCFCSWIEQKEILEPSHIFVEVQTLGVQGIEKQTLPSFGKICPALGYVGVAGRGGPPTHTRPGVINHMVTLCNMVINISVVVVQSRPRTIHMSGKRRRLHPGRTDIWAGHWKRSKKLPGSMEAAAPAEPWWNPPVRKMMYHRFQLKSGAHEGLWQERNMGRWTKALLGVVLKPRQNCLDTILIRQRCLIRTFPSCVGKIWLYTHNTGNWIWTMVRKTISLPKLPLEIFVLT